MRLYWYSHQSASGNETEPYDSTNRSRCQMSGHCTLELPGTEASPSLSMSPTNLLIPPYQLHLVPCLPPTP